MKFDYIDVTSNLYIIQEFSSTERRNTGLDVAHRPKTDNEAFLMSLSGEFNITSHKSYSKSRTQVIL